MSDFSVENAVPVSQTSQGTSPADTGSFNVDNAQPVESSNNGQSAYDSFSKYEEPEKKSEMSEMSDQELADQGEKDYANMRATDKGLAQPYKDNKKEATPDANKPQSKGVSGSWEENPDIKEGISPSGKRYNTHIPDRPPEDWLNATVHSAEGAAWNTFARPFTKNPQDTDEYLQDLEKKHPIASIVGGTAPFIVSAPFVPESLVPNIYLRTAAQFGLVGLGQGLNRAKDDPSKQIADKISDVSKETLKQMTYGPVFAKAQALQILDRPFVSALARAGVIAAGTGTLSKVYGDNLTAAFKQGGLYGALSLITEAPHLAGTVVGRGIIAHTNSVAADIASKSGLPYNQIDENSPDVAKQTHDAALLIAKNIKGIDKPQIAAATIKLPDGTMIHGTSHDDALAKIGQSKETMRELPNVKFQDQPGIGLKKLVNEKGEEVGKALFKDTNDGEGGAIDIIEKYRKEGYGPAAVNEFFKNHDNLIGEVGESNTNAQKWWKDIGAKLDQRKSGTYDLYLNKKEFLNKVKPFTAGFTVVHPDGHTEFITREQSKQSPYNLPNGHSEDVKGLNESKFMSQEDPIKIVNPDTLKMIEGNEGKMDIGMIPMAPEIAEVLKNSTDELNEKFRPYQEGEEGKYTAAVIRENLGQQARANDKVEAALRNARKFFDKAKKDDALDFIYRMEEGERQKTPELQKIADVLRNMLDTTRDKVRALGTGKLENFIENYFPHLWEDPNKVGAVIKKIMGKKPFQGPASFLKKRTIMSTKEGIDLGFTPVSYNPVDSVMLRVREMERYLMAHKSIQDLKEEGLIKFVRTGEKSPDGFVPIDDRFAQVTYKNDAKELVLAGKYMIQKDAGRILNNYLSPGLAGKSYIYDLYRGAGNTLNQFQLGISAFHLGFTSMDATISKFNIGVLKLSNGDYAGAIKEFGKAPFAPVTNLMSGDKLNRAWHGSDQGTLYNAVADAMASAGGRAHMDKFYATGIADSMKKSIKEGKLATAAFKAPFWLVEQAARPIMEYIVPRQKMGVFMDMMKMEMEKNPNMTHEQLRGIAQKAWDSVDNRMGQLVYDNLFWHKTTKDLAMASVRSLGWNLGTVRELGGGVKDAFASVNDLIHGRATQMSYRTGYVMSLPIVTGIYGAIYQYLHTGQWPQELKDYFFPKNGAIDNKGQAARVDLPTYMKDIYHYITNPVQTVINKFSPIINTVMEMLANKDFYGTQIRNVDDPIMQQIADESQFMASQFIPFGFRNQNRDTRTSLGSKVEPFIGITPAPYDINMTKAEREADTILKDKIPVGSRTKEQATHSQDKSKLRSDFMANKDPQVLEKAVEDGVISSKERRQIIKESKMTNLGRMTQYMTFEEVNHIMKVATPDEKVELEKILERKKENKESKGTWTNAEEDLYAKTFKSEE